MNSGSKLTRRKFDNDPIKLLWTEELIKLSTHVEIQITMIIPMLLVIGETNQKLL